MMLNRRQGSLCHIWNELTDQPMQLLQSREKQFSSTIYVSNDSVHLDETVRMLIFYICPFVTCILTGLGGSVGCVVRLETRRSRVQPRRGRQHSSVEIDHEIFSTVILSLPLIQEGELSVSGERMCTILVNRLED